MGTRISQFTPLTTVASGDYFPLVQASDTTNKRVSLASLLASVPLGAAATPSIAFTGDTDTGIYHPGANQVAISTNGTERLRVTDTGLVGIGISSPQDLFNVESATSPTIRLRNTTTGSNASPASSFISFYGYSSTGLPANAEARARIEVQDRRSNATGGFLNIATANTSSAFVNAIHIDNSQRVGIGTTSPDALLTVNGIGAFGAGAVTTPSIAATGDLNTGFWFPAADTIAASTSGAERARIDSSGRLLVGTSSAVSGADIQAATSLSIGGLVKREFSKDLGLTDNVATTYLTLAVPGGTVFSSTTNIGGEISYVIQSSRQTSGRGNRSVYGKVYFSISRFWESDANNPISADLVSTDQNLSSVGTGTAPTITWAISTDAGTDNASKNVYITITVDNPNAGTIAQGIAGTVTYHTRRLNANDVTVS